MKRSIRAILTVGVFLSVATGCSDPAQPAAPAPPANTGENEVLFRNLRWHCPFGCTLLIKDFDRYVGSSSAIRVLVKELADWIEATPWSESHPKSMYRFEISARDISIYTEQPINEGGAVDVMIKF